MNVSQILTIISWIIGIIGLSGGAVGYFAKSRGDAIIAYQAKEIELRDGTIARLEKENAALLREKDILKEQNLKLGELAQGSPKLAEVTIQIKALAQAVAALAKKTSVRRTTARRKRGSNEKATT